MNYQKQIYLPTAYLGPASYYAAIVASNSSVIEINETFRKQSIRNRCRILTSNGILNLTVPVQKPNGNHSRTEEIGICNDEKWYLMHWRAIESAYSASPYFLYYRDEIQDFIGETSLSLHEFNMKLLEKISQIIGISAEICFSELFVKPDDIEKSEITDLRYAFNKNAFRNIIFPPYTQVFSDRYGFQPDLSIIDLLFNLGPETLEYLKTIAMFFQKNQN